MKKKLFALLCVMSVIISSMITLPSSAQEESEATYEESASNPSRAATYTYSVGGVNADGHDFTPNVNYSATIFGLMSSVSNAYLNTAPSYSYLSGNNPGGYKRLGSKIVLLTGHASASTIALDNNNGNTKVGVCRDNSYTANSGRKYYGLNNVSMNNTDLIMFFGCNTATGDSNLCTKSISKGAKAAVGTKSTVVSRKGEGAVWVQRFIDGLYHGKTVAKAGAYANGFVSSSCSMRTGWTCKGQSGTIVNPGGSKGVSTDMLVDSNIVALDPSMAEEQIDIRVDLIRGSIVAEKASLYENELSGAVTHLCKIDSTFDISDYVISINAFDDGTSLISFNYMIGDSISTDKGFTFICKDGVLNTLTYNIKYYDGSTRGPDELMLEELVKEDMSKNKVTLSGDDSNHTYYTYSYASGKLSLIQESYIFDGEVWIDNYSERHLN